MKRFLFAVVVTILMVASTTARADSGGQLVLEGRTSWTILGVKNPTGGFTPGLAATWGFPLGDGAALGIGGDFGVFGFGGAARWIGVLAGPTAKLMLKSSGAPVAFSIGVAADFGRVPVCTPWESPICPRFVGFFPAATVGVMYVSDSGLMLGASFSARVISTLIGTSGSYEPGLVVGVYLSQK